MSLSMLLLFVACVAAYRLGAFNERCPGRTRACCGRPHVDVEVAEQVSGIVA